MRVLLDNNLSVLVERLAARGIDAVHISSLGAVVSRGRVRATWTRPPGTLSVPVGRTDRMRGIAHNDSMDDRRLGTRAAQLPGAGWRTGQDRTRLLVTYLWDGRCGRCARPLVRLHELGLAPAPLDVDHVLPTDLGGRDELVNYMASCASCNRSRQARLICDDAVIRGVLRMRWAVRESFDDYWERATATDPAFEAPFWTAIRCADHGWHIDGSPAHLDCSGQARIHRQEVFSPQEWWSRFGSRSREVLDAAATSSRRHGLGDLDAWAVRAHLPRYARSPEHALALLNRIATPDRYRVLVPAPDHLLSVTVPLAAYNTAASARRRDNKATLALHARLKEVDIDWLGIARLWTQRHWPSSHLFYHRSAVLELAASGKRSALADLASLDAARAVDRYLADIRFNL